MRFVNSLSLGESRRSSLCAGGSPRFPGVRFKLDAEATWAPALVDQVAATGAVDTIDFKGHYGFEVEDPQALGALYDHVLAAFPDAYLEDPHDLPEIAQRLADHLDRVSYDSPICSADDIGTTPLAARVANVKPSPDRQPARCSRSTRAVRAAATADVRQRHGRARRGRGRVELLAALFRATTPNDVAPSAPTTRTTRQTACRPAHWRRALRPPAPMGRVGQVGARLVSLAMTQSRRRGEPCPTRLR